MSDSGAGIEDPLAGQLIPPLEGIGGRGIWLARMLSDAVEIRSGARLHRLDPCVRTQTARRSG